MRIEYEVKLDFKDVLIRPKRSTLRVRPAMPRGLCVCIFDPTRLISFLPCYPPICANPFSLAPRLR